VCEIQLKGFYVNAKDGVSTKEDGVPHLKTKDIEFCPIVDDHSIYHAYENKKRQAKLEYNDRYYQKRKGS
jgi:hypothetical protein